MAKTPSAPRHLRPETQKWWAHHLAEYHLEPHHVRLLTLAAEAWDRCQEARAALAQHGIVYVDRFGQPRARPEVGIERDSRVAFARMIRELNLDLASPEEPRLPRLTAA
jgi:phage terminase small subunit